MKKCLSDPEMETYFIELSAILQNMLPDIAKFVDLAALYGHKDAGLKWTPALKAADHLKMNGE